LYAENINDLKNKQKQAKEKIELTNKLLNETQTNKKATVSNLNVIKVQINQRQELIENLTSEITLLDQDLDKTEDQKTLLENRLNTLKKEYASLVYHSYFYKNRSAYNQFIFILSSNSFNQIYRRMRYVQEYSQYRKEQSLEIMQVTQQLQAKANELESKKVNKQSAVINKEKETQKLQEDQKSKEKMLSELSKKEKKLREDLKQQQKLVNELNAKIDQLIAREIAIAERKAKAKKEREAAAAAAKERNKVKSSNSNKSDASTASGKLYSGTKSSTVNTTITAQDMMTHEESLIAGGFEKNQGRLPWPSRGVITGHFGIQKHPKFPIEINNKGIYIQTQQGADAYAVYEGEVTQIFAIPGSNNAIIVKHGNYRTVYANLTNTFVKVGDKVSAKQRLGKIFVDDQQGNKTELYFMVYKNSVLQNPETWLSR
jgi:septal ring factor EnvC (AmiA/AmiB activator)